jgi:sulfatase maturation enzyme AslB (radical SAM superfamily)
VQLWLHLLLPKKKGGNRLPVDQIFKAIDYFLPFFVDKCSVDFTGGEPLLAFDAIKQTVAHVQKKEQDSYKKIIYSLTTNGSLIDGPTLEFLCQNRFYVLLSFDGFAQEITRKPGSFVQTAALIEKLSKNQDITLETNSVFIPETVGYLSRSIDFVAGLGVENILLSFSNYHPWDQNSLEKLEEELTTLKNTMISFYKKTGQIPLQNFRKNSSKGILYCTGGETKMALSQDGRLWGCYLFIDYFKGKEATKEFQKYCFGHLDHYTENSQEIHPEVAAYCKHIKLSCCYTDDQKCGECEEIRECKICPVSAAYATGILGKIPAWTCELRKMLRSAKKSFWKEMDRLDL